MPFRKGDRVQLNGSALKWTGTVVQDQTHEFVSVRFDDYQYMHDWAPGNGYCHTYEAKNFTLLASATPSVTSGLPINDHVCTTCGNNRCSKNERSCWKCGAPIQIG